jgi:hypothetical protein
MKIYKHCEDLAARLEIQLAFLEAAIKNEKIDNHLNIKSKTQKELDASEYQDIEEYGKQKPVQNVVKKSKRTGRVKFSEQQIDEMLNSSEPKNEIVDNESDFERVE